MKRTDGFQNTASYQIPAKKYSAIHNYLRRINQIKNDTQVESVSKRPHNYSHSNFMLSSAQFNRTSENQIIFEKSNAQTREKKRCFSMKSQIPPEYPTPSNKTKLNTVYNQKFNLTNVKIRQNLFEQSIKNHDKNQTEMRNKPQKGFYQTKSSNKKVFTEPNETFFSSFDSKARINTTFSQNNIQRQESIEKMQIAKKQIFEKIHLYVMNLDQKGEDELNQMLTNEYRKRIRFHNDAYRYQTKIKEMIKTNKEIVNLLKQELLKEKTITFSSQRINLSQPYVLLSSQSLSLDKNIIIDQLEPNFQDKLKKETQNFQSTHVNFQQNDSPDSKEDHQKSKSKLAHQQILNDRDYQNEVHHVTKQFQSEWTKSQAHKKAIYQKFRSTIFQNYPEIRKRQRAIKKSTNEKITLSPSSSDDQIELPHNQIDGNKNSKIELKNDFGVKSPQMISRKIQVQLKTQVSPSKSNARQSLLNTYGGEGKQNFEKTVKLSKKNSISKGSSRVLDLLQSEDKKEVARINFENLIDFIFKRAFFYSVSKKKIIQNKVPYGKMQYVPPVEKKDPNISFMLYNKSIKEKHYLKTEKLNEKKLRATGNFLIKNKYKIMGLEKEGNSSCEFLRKCLEDAVEDYLRGSKSK